MGPVLAKMDVPGSGIDLSIFDVFIVDSNKFHHECLFEQVGLKGEAMNLVSPNGISSVEWMEGSLAAQKQQPLRWHKVNKNEKQKYFQHELWLLESLKLFP